MSTYWYFECLDHDPPLRSADEFTQHTDDAPFKHAVDLAQHRDGITNPWVGEWQNASEYFDRNARRFLVEHPACRLGLINEYDERRPLAPIQEGTP